MHLLNNIVAVYQWQTTFKLHTYVCMNVIVTRNMLILYLIVQNLNSKMTHCVQYSVLCTYHTYNKEEERAW